MLSNVAFRLNGWQRIGIVLSILWIIFACGVVTYQSEQFSREIEGPMPPRVKLDCPNDAATISTECFVNAPAADGFYQPRPKKIREYMWNEMFAALGLFALVPLIFTWGFVVLLVRIIRWIAEGFKKQGGG